MPIDYSEYPENWHDISRRIRFERAGGRCESCGAENGEPHPATGSIVVLTVAHLNHKILDCRDENLKALCQKCHLGHDRPRHIANRRYGRRHMENNYNLFPETDEQNSS